MDEGSAAAVRPMTPEQIEAFYAAGYPKLVKILVLIGAAIAEAEDAAQKAMTDFVRRAQTASPPAHPEAYVRQAAVRFFIKERQRDRERLPRELRGGHLVTETHLDDRLTSWEDEQDIELILECLTPTQQRVIRLVMGGLSTSEIAEELGKADDNVRQQLKKARDRLKSHPEIAPLTPRQEQDPRLYAVRPAATALEPRKEEVQ